MHEGVPADRGFRMPAEWETHEATWLAWPHQVEDWPGKFEPIPWVYADVVHHLHTRERVRILVRDGSAHEQAADVLRRRGIDLTRIDFFEIPTDRSWIRDFGAIFVRNGAKQAALDWRFNGWAKYDNHRLDDRVASMMAERVGAPTWQPRHDGKRVVLEGGSIDVNGAGLLLTTEECLLSPVQARNPDLGRSDLERVFADYLGVEKTLWLGRGIVGDDTHGHIDDLARFVAETTIVTVVEHDPSDENYSALQENRERLCSMTTQTGQRLDIVELPMPEPLFFEGQRLPASYANFYIANELVLVPTFNDPNDRIALGILGELFPERSIVGIHAGELVWGLGTLHCMTQQQ